MFCNLRIIT